MSRTEGEKTRSKKAKKTEDAEPVDASIASQELRTKEKKEKKEKKAKKEFKDKKEQTEPVVKVEKKDKASKKDKAEKSEKVEKAEKKDKKAKSSASTFGAPSAKTAFDPTISSLFANSFGPSKPSASTPAAPSDDDEDDDEQEDVDVEMDDEELSEIDVDSGDEDVDAVSEDEEEQPTPAAPDAIEDGDKKRKRKRKDEHEDLEDVYMERLAREEAKAIAKQKEERASKRQRKTDGDASEDDADSQDEETMVDGASASDDDEAGTPPPVHESLLPEVDTDLEKSRRTVFLANVSTDAITSKSAEKTLRNHMSSFFDKVDAPVKDQPAHKIESIRFRSTAFASAIPKKAAFAKKELMEATTKSTNAYVVYSSQQLAREAARRLNGTMVLDRHLRVDEVAHPAKVDHKRCIFVGNLGFVDDESNIDAANEEEGKGKRNGRKVPSDIEEGLWRSFGTCGTVESVRVVRDSKTRVGKGFAYVQFTDENAVEAALLLNEKKFPPMLPRKLRVSRAKAIKRNAKPGASAARPPTHTRSAKGGGVYNPKMTSEESSKLGRAGKLFGRAHAAQLRSGDVKASSGIRGPESFIFEGHRASSKGGKTGLKLGGKKKGGKPGGRSAKRGAAWKSSGGKN